MKLCIPTVDARGANGPLSDHFGSAPYFTLVDSDTGETEVVANPHAHHPAGRCETAAGLPGLGVEAVICHGLGRRALDHLGRLGMPVMVTDADRVASALSAFRVGALVPLAPEAACHGGGGHCH